MIHPIRGSNGCFTKGPVVPLEERFWAKVNRDGPVMPKMTTPCWVWTASLTNHGYGQINVYGQGPKKAYKVALELAGVVISPGLHVHHQCENRVCVRADHLALVHGNRGHLMEHRSGCSKHGEGEMASVRSGKNVGMRYCRACNREKAARRNRDRGVRTREEYLDDRFGCDRPGRY